jgi:hypothetical protein
VITPIHTLKISGAPSNLSANFCFPGSFFFRVLSMHALFQPQTAFLLPQQADDLQRVQAPSLPQQSVLAQTQGPFLPQAFSVQRPAVETQAQAASSVQWSQV